MRYKFFATDNKVICVSSFARKPVRGIAKCNPKDAYDLSTGKKLAQMRCDYKIALKRRRRAAVQFEEASNALAKAIEYCNRMKSYYEESCKELQLINQELEKFEDSL